jgi:hypothetical protein
MASASLAANGATGTVFWLFGHQLPGGGHAHLPVVAHATGHAFAAAAVNGTILAIVIAGLSGYLLIVFQSINRMQTDVIESCSVSPRRTPLGAGIFQHPDFDPNGLSLDDLLDALKRIEAGVPTRLGIDRFPDKSDPAGRGMAVMVMIVAIQKVAPFDDVATPTTIGEAEAWIEKFGAATTELGHRWGESAPESLPALILAAEDREKPTRPAGFPVSYQPELSAFEVWTNEWMQTIAKAQAALGALRRYERRQLPAAHFVRLVAIAVFAAFMGGVALPMVKPSVSDLVYAWFPAVLYTTVLVYGVRVAFSRYPGPRNGA